MYEYIQIKKKKKKGGGRREEENLPCPMLCLWFLLTHEAYDKTVRYNPKVLINCHFQAHSQNSKE
jgi:hypothetical protein